MSNDVKGFIVSLKNDIPDNFANKIIEAIRLLEGVDKVDKVPVETSDYLNRMQIKTELSKELWEVLWGKK